ncbi:MAG TPA: hypothetical protein CFH81_08965 [Sulfurovum sp. UBA12169]|nr:MAG TPA: hypothetical protein CFH81_08965 [Sulfurovum sp. UBA12169]
MVLDAQPLESGVLIKKVLILSDGRAGHVSQSVALAKYAGATYDIVQVAFKSKAAKLLSMILDACHVYTQHIYDEYKIPESDYDAVVSAGSSTYYLNKTISKKLHAKSIAMMLPKGYRYDFDVIFAQHHDAPPFKDNIVQIPANFAYVEPGGIYRAKRPSIGIVIGGDNKYFTFSKEKLKLQLSWIKQHFKGYEIAVTTSPRTSKEIDALIKSSGFDYTVIYSENPVNPIPDFISRCETVCITSDSTSMVSEALCAGKANVMILPLESKKENKFTRFIKSLQKQGYVHIFDGTFKPCSKKIDFCRYAKEAKL